MKKILYAFLFTGICAWTACSNGDYQANPSSPGNGGIAPVNPLTSTQFSWSGTAPFSANIDGAGFVADNAYYTHDSTWANQIYASKGSTQFYFYLSDVWKDNLYNLGYHQYTRYCQVSDSVSGLYETYYSFNGNSGGLWMLENDSAYFAGQFYFKGITDKGKVINITNGYFKLAKPL